MSGWQMDEFEIKGTGHKTDPDRIWTRSDPKTAEHIALQVVHKLGFARAEVVNTYGGHRSNPLVIVTPGEIEHTPES